MSFQSGWPLLLLLPLLLWCASEWSKSPRRLGLLLKVLTLAAVCLALARPRWQIQETYVTVALLNDVSESIPYEQRGQQRSYHQRARAAVGGHSLRNLEFGSFPLRELRERETGRSTNLEAAIRNAMSALPADRIPRLVLLSDGLANEGAVERAVYQAWKRRVPIDIVELRGRPEPRLRLSAVRTPTQAFTGERFSIEFEAISSEPMRARLELRADGSPIGSEELQLPDGASVLTARARIESPGTALLEGLLTAGEDEEVRVVGAVSIRRPRALLISSDTEEQNLPLTGVVQAAGFELEHATGVRALTADTVTEYDLILASNEDFQAWPETVKEWLAGFVRQGGGFLLIAGERNLYRERPGEVEDALQAMLPAKLAPPRTPEGTAVVLVVDKSSSMEGKKMQLARQSALGVVENLRPIDTVGVLAFDNSFAWAAPLQRNKFPGETKRLISGIVADGGTQIAPALNEAYRSIKPQRAVYKHILLLTDGISEEGDSIALAREAAANEVSISTIGLGQDVNRSYLERVARSAEGKSYFLLDISALEQIVLKDVMEHTGTSVTEREFLPTASGEYEILEEIDLDQPGPLLGWVKFEAKPEAETLLRAGDDDPLLVRWQFGLGRAAVFTSDAKDRWATNWVAWDGFDTFWANVLRDILPRAAPTETETEYDPASDEIIVRYRPSPRAGPITAPPLYAVGPDGYRHVANPKPVGGDYEARFPAEGRYGLFRVRPEDEARAFPEVAHYRENSELLRYGADAYLLRSIAEATGGRANPAPEEIFATDGRSIERWMDLWPLFLALAIVLNLLELLARKGWLPVLGRWA